MLISCRARMAVSDAQVAREVSGVLERRAALARPPASPTVSDAVALGIAARHGGRGSSGQVMDRLLRLGTVDSDEFIAAARFEQGFAGPEEHAALHCLIGWARGRADAAARVPVA
jgi:hypothetical protein